MVGMVWVDMYSDSTSPFGEKLTDQWPMHHHRRSLHFLIEIIEHVYDGCYNG
jgi:hypothetical protein